MPAFSLAKAFIMRRRWLNEALQFYATKSNSNTATAASRSSASQGATGTTARPVVSTLIAHYENLAAISGDSAYSIEDHKNSSPNTTSTSSTSDSSTLQRRFIETYDPKEPDFDFEPTRPSEVVYGHLKAMENRLKLFQLFQLNEQIDLDTSSLRNFSPKKSFALPRPLFMLQDTALHIEKMTPDMPDLKEPHQYLRFQSSMTVIGGLKDYVEPSDAFLSLSFYPKHTIWHLPKALYQQLSNSLAIQDVSLKNSQTFKEGSLPTPSRNSNKPLNPTKEIVAFQLGPVQLHKFCLLCRPYYDIHNESIMLTANRFPFIELNRQYLMDVLLSLLKESFVSFHILFSLISYPSPSLFFIESTGNIHGSSSQIDAFV
jgi:Mitochondrial ribosomal subunit protein